MENIIDRSKEIIEGYHQMELDGLIIIGGDGSMQILKKLAKRRRYENCSNT